MHYNLEIGIIEKINQRECKLTTYHITHTHSSENCFSGNDEIMSLWKQIEKTIGQCKKTGDFRVTPVMEQTFNPK